MRIQISVPPNTAQDAPQKTIVQFDNPVLTREIIDIPDGHAYLTGIQIRVGNNLRIIPEPDSNVEWMVGNFRTIVKNIRYSVSLPSFQVEILAYNEDDTYTHSFYIDLEA